MDDDFGISIHNRDSDSTRRYRADGANRWELEEACRMAAGFIYDRDRTTHVNVGNSTQDFRLWRPDETNVSGDFTMTPTGPRWSAWYVDVEIAGHRWVFHPLADLHDQEAAEELAAFTVKLPAITRVWVGASDGSEEFEYETNPE